MKFSDLVFRKYNQASEEMLNKYLENVTQAFKKCECALKIY